MSYYLMLIKHVAKVVCRECIESLFTKLAKFKWRPYVRKR